MRVDNKFKNICQSCKLPMLFHNTGQVHMTEGPIVQQLLCFMIPILVSQLLQQFYGIADTAMVGFYLGPKALAALGTTGIVLNVIVNFYIGLSAGISVILSKLFGGYEYKQLNGCIQTILVSCGMAGLLFTFLGLTGMDSILGWLATPADIVPLAAAYLGISFLGLTAQLLYNAGNAILQALGNTTSAFHYLLLSSLINIILDYAFLVIIPLGVVGAALATVFSQYLAAALVIRKIFCLDGDWHFKFSYPLINCDHLRLLVSKGVPAGMQAVFMSISTLLIQTYVNSFGYGAMAGLTVYAKVEGFLYNPSFAFGLALTSFIGQNVGAGKLDRVRQGMKLSLYITVIGSIVIGGIMTLLAPNILRVFTSDNTVLVNGLEAVYYTFPFYWCYAINQVYIGGLRGLGNTFYPMLTSLFAYSVFRVAWCQCWDFAFHDMRVVYTAYDVSFFIMAVLLVYGYRYNFKKFTV